MFAEGPRGAPFARGIAPVIHGSGEVFHAAADRHESSAAKGGAARG
jgi:hypothetical protein